MSFKQKVKKFLKSDWSVALYILIAFLFTNGYTYGWDDQHLEIPLLKHLIDNSLFVGDYYVESLKNNFVTIFYPLLAKCITTEQIPTAYFILYLISRYFLFFWSYKMWKHISKSKGTAVLCTMGFFLLVRVEEFIYRTFSHQEFSLAIIFAGFYYFFLNRFILAAAIFGLGANFHALYSLFPMLYLLAHITFNVKKDKIKQALLSCAAFSILALPTLIWIFKEHFSIQTPSNTHIYDNWIDLFWIACSQNFPFLDVPLEKVLHNWTNFFSATKSYWLLFSLYFLNKLHNPLFYKEKKTQAIMGMTLFLLIFTFFFSYIVPVRSILDLNLVRNSQFLLFFLMGYTTILAIHIVRNYSPGISFLTALMFSTLCMRDLIGAFSAIALTILLSFHKIKNVKNSLNKSLTLLLMAGGLLFCVFGVWKAFLIYPQNLTKAVKVIIMFAFILANYFIVIKLKNNKNIGKIFKTLFIIIPFCVIIFHYAQGHIFFYEVKKNGLGFWQLQRNWIDMQKYVKKNTSKSAHILVPHDMEMGGFRIGSERKIVVSYRDCGIIGFDYPAVVEWKKRLDDVKDFQVYTEKPIKKSIMNAVTKYNVDYIVFMTYYAPKESFLLKRIYENSAFVLYKVNK